MEKQLASLGSLEAEREGFEPPVGLPRRRFSRPDNDPRNDQVYQEIRDESSGEVPVLVPSPPGAVSGPPYCPDLARVVGAWDRLPDAIRTAILALVQAAGGAGA